MRVRPVVQAESRLGYLPFDHLHLSTVGEGEPFEELLDPFWGAQAVLRPAQENDGPASAEQLHRDVAAQVYPMAGVTPKDVDVFATYDSFRVHLLASLEGFGFCNEGEGGAFVQNGRIEIGGELPCNTSGGMLSESYMQSWNHQPELVRQLRGGLGPRQVQGAEVAQYVHDVAGKCKSIIYTKGS